MEETLSARRRTGILLICSMSLFIVGLDITAVNVGLPSIGRELHAGISGLQWTVDAYTVVLASLLLFSGSMADRLGRKRTFVAGLGVFTTASLLCSVAPSVEALVAFRVLQAVGASMMNPVAMSIITNVFTDPRERAQAVGVWGALFGISMALGPVVGGALVSSVGWRAIFLINLPVGIAVAAMTRHVVPADIERPRWRGLDLRGAVLATGGLGAVVFAISRAADAGWTSGQTLGISAAGVVVLLVFGALELRTANPLLKVERLGERAVGGGMLMMLAVSAVLFGSFLLSSIYMQEVLASSALVTGLAFLPMALAVGAGAHVGGHVIGHGGVRAPMAFALAVASGGLLLLSGVDASGSYVGDLLPGMLITGIGLGVALVAVATSVLTDAADDETGMLSGLNTTGHEIGGSLGVAVLISVATAAGGSSPAGGSAAVAAGIGDAFQVAGGIAGAAAIIALVVLPSASTFLPKLRLAPRVAVH
jgi:EmrB/QacA subfamily drug resistance transporter